MKKAKAITVLSRPLISIVLLCLLSLPLQAKPLLRVLTWPGYADADLVEAFAERYDADVEVTLVGNDDELRLKLSKDGGMHYDVIAANTSEINYFVQQQLLQPLRLANLTNRNGQLQQFRQLNDIPGLMHQGQAYGVPYVYGEMGLIYNRKMMDRPPNSIDSLWDPQWQGQVLAYDGSSHSFSLARQALAKPPFATPNEEMPATLVKLVELRRNVLSFYSLPEESVSLFTQNPVALMYANYGRQQLKLLQDAGADVGYVIPKEGAFAWLDCWAITRTTPNRALAEQWINYSLEPQVSGALTERQGLENTLRTLHASNAPLHLVWLEPVENAELRAKLWQSILAGERPENLVQP
jgi:putative spermidine/putrescine transport system substrate-binding protein